MSRPRIACALLVFFCCVGCDDADATEAPAIAEGRVNAVVSSKKTGFPDLCDVAPSAGKAPFAWPELAEGVAPAPAGGYRWVNVWATWCKPCVEELPLLRRTTREWSEQGKSVALTLLSVDADAEAMQSFLQKQEGAPSSLRIREPALASPWLESLGLPSGSAIPVHLLVDARGQLVCARAGGIGEQDVERFARAMFP